MAKINVRINSANAIKTLQEKQAQIAQAKVTSLQRIGQMQVDTAKQRITQTKTGPDGQPWAAWSMATQKERRRQGNASRGLLWRTGALLQSIQFTIENNVLRVFSDVPYAHFLQFGTPKMPARPFLGFSDQINKILDTIKEQLR